MADFGPLHVKKGDVFSISQLMNSPNAPCLPPSRYPCDGRTTISIYAEDNVNPADPRPLYPSRNWKFFEVAHDGWELQHCGGWAASDMEKGWIAYGGLTDDSLSVAAYDMWFSMHIDNAVPLQILDVTAVHNTIDTGPQTIDASLVACYPAHPESAGVIAAVIRWKLDGIEQPAIPMADVGGDTWEGQIPGEPGNSSVSYYIDAMNLQGVRSFSPTFQYRVVKTRTEWYAIDLSYACVSHDIASTGTVVDTASFFTTSFRNHGTSPGDDGTSGPYDIGKKFVFFGDTVRWAWIGVNGAMTLSKAATDTLDANSNGSYVTTWTIPFPIYHHRADTARGSITGSTMPPNILLPFWNDLVYGQVSPQARFGRILYGDRGDTCLFIAEWDSLGVFITPTLPAASDDARFRIVLNTCDGTVTYEYDNVGSRGLDSTALVGMQGDSTGLSGPIPGYILANQNGAPLMMRPASGMCLHFVPEIGFYADDGWNLVSAAVNAYGGNYSRSYLFPKAVSPAYGYQTGYKQAEPLSEGRGYWMKFSGAQYVGAPGTMKTSVSMPLAEKWNVIGSISLPVPAAALVTLPPGIISSNVYGYRSDSGYTVASAIMPGRAYWVKTSSGGTLILSSSGNVPKTVPLETELARANRLTVTDSRLRSQDLFLAKEGTMSRPAAMFEMPPPPPDGGFDVRFASERMLESYPANPAGGKPCEYTVNVNSALYPLTIRWDMKSESADRSFVLSDLSGGKILGSTVLSGRGQVKIANAGVKRLSIKLARGLALPKEFALSQNYPNPFNPATRFEVSIPRLSLVEIVVYDVLGRRIATVMRGIQPAGYVTVEWDGRDSHDFAAPTGIYFVRMAADGFSATRKVLLMK
jgi:hypothetical protein